MYKDKIDGLVQDRCNYIANALALTMELVFLALSQRDGYETIFIFMMELPPLVR